MTKKSLSKLEILGIVAGSTTLACLCIFIFLLWYYPTIRERLIRFLSSCSCCSCWSSRIGKRKQEDSWDEYNFPPRRDNNNLNNAVSLGDVMVNSSLIFPTVTLANSVQHYTSDESSLHRSRRFSRKISTDYNSTNGERSTIVQAKNNNNIDTSVNNTHAPISNNHNNKNNKNCPNPHPFSLSRRGSKTNSEEEFNEELESQMTQSLYELEKIHKELAQTLELDRQSQDENFNNNNTAENAENNVVHSTQMDENTKIINESGDENLQTINENKSTSTKKMMKQAFNNNASITSKGKDTKGKTTNNNPMENVEPMEEEQHVGDDNKDAEIPAEEKGKEENRENSSDLKFQMTEMTTSKTVSPLKEKTNRYKNELKNDDNPVEINKCLDTNNNDSNNKTVDDSMLDVRSIIIAVDATPKNSGGYLIVPDKQLCESYSVPIKMLPWRLKNMTKRGNSSEFEMKNLLFALLNWEDRICEYENIWLYTDNMGILENGLGSRQGLNVRAFLRHLKTCKNITILNKSPYVHTYRNYKEYDRYIIPADHLSRRRFFQFKCHVQQHFPDITTFRTGFHKQKVEEKIDNFIKYRCTTCKFRIRVTGSLRDTLKRKARIIRSAIPDFATNHNENQQK